MKNQNQDRNWRQNESNQRNQNQFSRNRQWENQNNAWQQHQPEHRDPWQSDYREYPAEQQRGASFGQHENYSSPYRGNQGNGYRVNDNDNYNQAGIYGNQYENDRDRGYNTGRYQQDNRQQYYRGQQNTSWNENRYGNEYNTSDHSMFRGNESTKQYQGNNQWGSNEGNYRGYGPKSYKRSDERIHEDINDLLTNHSLINAYDVDVKVNNGDVVLEGSVESRNAKRMIEDIVEDVSGVKNVENRLRISNGMEVNPEGALDSADRRKPEKTTANK